MKTFYSYKKPLKYDKKFFFNCLTPFQGLIDEVVKVDDELSGIVEQIRILAEDIEDRDSISLTFDNSEIFSENIIRRL